MAKYEDLGLTMRSSNDEKKVVQPYLYGNGGKRWEDSKGNVYWYKNADFFELDALSSGFYSAQIEEDYKKGLYSAYDY